MNSLHTPQRTHSRALTAKLGRTECDCNQVTDLTLPFGEDSRKGLPTAAFHSNAEVTQEIWQPGRRTASCADYKAQEAIQ